jgi:peptidyl-prolyl cis-trans isomerase C
MAKDAKSDGNVADVNGTAITQEELSREVALLEQRMSRSGGPSSQAPKEVLQKRALKNLIGRELLYQESEKEGIQVNAAEIQGQIDALKSRYPNEKAFEEALGSMQLTDAELKTQIKKGTAIQHLIKKNISPSIVVNVEDEKKFYESNRQLFKRPEEVKARHILIKVDPDATEAEKKEARKKIKNVQRELKEGQDFEKLAKKNSEGPSAANGGDLGYFRKGQMVKPFEKTAFAMPVGEVSDVVETRFGYHLIKVEDHRPAQEVPFKDVQKDIGTHLKRQKTGQAVEEYIQALEKKANIEIQI